MKISSRRGGAGAVGFTFTVFAGLAAACSGSTPSGGTQDDAGGQTPSQDGSVPPNGGGDGSVAPPKGNDASVTHSDAGSPTQDASTGPVGTSDGGSGGVTRNPKCTPSSGWTGNLINTTHGRLDGTLVFIVPAGENGCDSDASHLHLQVEVSGIIYDVAVDVGTTDAGNGIGWYEQTMAPPLGAWTEGWHGNDGLGYKSLGLSSSQFADLAPPAASTEIMTLLENTSQISVFCSGYTSDNGCHDVHYENGSSTDGALVLDPTAASSPVLFLRFQNQSF